MSFISNQDELKCIPQDNDDSEDHFPNTGNLAKYSIAKAIIKALKKSYFHQRG